MGTVRLSNDDPYKEISDRINDVASGNLGFTQLLPVAPRRLPATEYHGYRERYMVIREFCKTTLDLFQASLRGDADPSIAELLINESPPHLAKDYHRQLPPHLYHVPRFFRTDQASHQHPCEVQCPGSMWGDFQLLWDFFEARGQLDGGLSLSEGFIESLTDHLGEQPRVLHLVDNASAPQGVRYFIERTRPQVKYFGYDAELGSGTGSLACNFVRSHSFFGLLAENLIQARLREAARTGTSVFDLPPCVVLDQKVPCALPFEPLTMEYYSDAVRGLFPYTALVSPASSGSSR
jgi:hypothetical protein